MSNNASARAPVPLSIIVPTWNGQTVIGSCLKSLQTIGARTVTIVDNASADRTIEAARHTAPDVRTIVLPENRGFAAACNRGIKASNTPYVLLLNQDAGVIPDGMAALLMCLEQHPEAAAAGGRIENPDGSLQPSMGLEPRAYRIALDRVPGIRAVIPTHVYRNPSVYASPREPAWLTGACLLLRRSALEDVGLFDESYFMYTEDLDWCTRARKRGWKLRYLPVRTAVHADEGRRPDRAEKKAAWMREGLLRYFETHGTPTEARMFRFLLAAERILRRAHLKNPFLLQ